MQRINQVRRNSYLRTSQRALYGIIAPPPPWLRRLSDPPPKLVDDEWSLIEHIRATGQIESGSLLGNDHLFERGIPEHEGLPPLDMNARERLASQRAQDEAIAKALKAEAEAAAARRKAKRAQRAAEHAEWERERAAAIAAQHARQAADEAAWNAAQRQTHWQFSHDEAIAREAALAAAAQRRLAEGVAAAQKARIDTAMDIAIAQRNAVQQAIVAKVRHAHRKAKIVQALEAARIRGQGEISVQVLMQAIDCFDDVEIYSCMQELGVQWRMPPKDVSVQA
jgi:hypothetical protein